MIHSASADWAPACRFEETLWITGAPAVAAPENRPLTGNATLAEAVAEALSR
jgi:hypothetical protein